MMHKSIGLFCLGLVIWSCSQTPKTQSVAERYFEVLAAEQNRQQLESFYGSDFVFEDIFLRQAYASPTEFLDLAYQWGREDMERANGRFLQLDELICTDSTAVAIGHFSETTFNGRVFPPTDFVIHLNFDNDLKIKSQRDFVQYSDQTLMEVIQFRNNFRLQGAQEP